MRAAKAVGLNLEWTGVYPNPTWNEESEKVLDFFCCYRSALEVASRELQELACTAFVAQFGRFDRPLYMDGAKTFKPRSPTLENRPDSWQIWLDAELARKRAMEVRDQDAWLLAVFLEERAERLKIEVWDFLLEHMVRGGRVYSRMELEALFETAEFGLAMDLEVDRTRLGWFQENVEERFAAAAASFVLKRTAPGPGRSFTSLGSFLSDVARRQTIDNQISLAMEPAVKQSIRDFSIDCLRQPATDAEGQHHLLSAERILNLENMPSAEEIAASALPPPLFTLFPSKISAELVSTISRAELVPAVKIFLLEKVSAALLETKTAPKELCDAALGFADIASLHPWLLQLLGHDVSPVLNLHGRWLDELLVELGDAEVVLIAESSLQDYGYPLPKGSSSSNEGSGYRRVVEQVKPCALEHVRTILRPFVQRQNFEWPEDFSFTSAQDNGHLDLVEIKSRFPANFAFSKLLVRQQWEAEVAAEIVVRLRNGTAGGQGQPLAWLCKPPGATKVSDSALARRINASSKKGAFVATREAIVGIGQFYEGAIKNEALAVPFDPLSENWQIPEAFLERLGFDRKCRLLDLKWREVIACRIYNKTKDGRFSYVRTFEEAFKEFGILDADPRHRKCVCGKFYSKEHYPLKFLERNHWCPLPFER